jgi:hypothetical protein
MRRTSFFLHIDILYHSTGQPIGALAVQHLPVNPAITSGARLRNFLVGRIVTRPMLRLHDATPSAPAFPSRSRSSSRGDSSCSLACQPGPPLATGLPLSALLSGHGRDGPPHQPDLNALGSLATTHARASAAASRSFTHRTSPWHLLECELPRQAKRPAGDELMSGQGAPVHT